MDEAHLTFSHVSDCKRLLMPLYVGELPFLLSEAIYQVDLTSLGIFIPRQCVPAFPFCPCPMPYMSHTSQNKLPLYHHSGVLRALSAPPSGEIWTLYTAFGRGGPHSSLRHLPRSLFFHPLLRALALSPEREEALSVLCAIHLAPWLV